MLLRRYIKEVITISERNQPNLLKKSLPYDLLIADINNITMSRIYVDFQNSNLIDSFIDASTGSADVSYDDNSSIEENSNALLDSSFSLIKLKKNKNTIKHLKNNYSFNFKNCNLNDRKPILCAPVNAFGGDNSAHVSAINNAEFVEKKEELIKNQTIKDLEDWNWAAHDLHHGETAISTDGDRFIDTNSISSTNLPNYNAPQTGIEYMDKHAPSLYQWPHGETNRGAKIRDYWLTLIGFYFNKIRFTRGVGGVANDIWASIYAYCLTKMSRPEDAYDIDFTIVNEPGKRTLIVGKGEIKKLQVFFANAYTTVHKYSMLSNLKDNIIYIANMF